jgi:DNA/RNA-binding domain of Phe-tRNA-synthetase-like protein
MTTVAVAAHPLLEAAIFAAELPRPLGELASPQELLALLAPSAPSTPSAPAPLRSDDSVRAAVRDLLRAGGFKPTGRSKPASEYLIRAAAAGELASINLVVDACNAVSLHSGIPISVVDLDRARPPYSIDVAPQGASYVFNASGQTIDLGGLLCLADADGPCANAVKDAQRTKTGAATRRVLAVLWGTIELPGRAAEASRWYRALLEGAGGRCEVIRGA